ncbi:hypothetical protein ACQ4PT_059268 [Festuca glaucescens]
MSSSKLCLAREKVLGTEDLLAEILIKLGSSQDLIRAAAVSPQWWALAKGGSFKLAWVQRHEPAHVGFLVEMQEGIGRIQKLMYGPQLGEVTAVAIRRYINNALLAGDNIIGSSNGIILTHNPGEGYCTSFPGGNPRIYKAVAPSMPPIPRDTEQHTVNTFGQFGVLPQAGRSGVSCFVKDASRPFLTCYDGVSFCSSESIYVHVSIYDDEVGWTRFVSEPIPSPEAALFHRNPYTVLVGSKLYMMYVVGFIVCFDLVSKTFTEVPLPGEVLERVSSWYDYSVARHRGGAIVLVHYHKSVMYTWVLSFSNEGPSWDLETMVDLIHCFGNRISSVAWKRIMGRENFPIGADNFYSIQVRSTSSDGRFVLLTLGFDLGMFELDMLDTRVREITNPTRSGLLGRMFPLSEPWEVTP